MGSGPRWLLVVVIVVLGIGEIGWVWYQGIVRARVELQAQVAAEQRNDRRPLPDTSPHAFTRSEANDVRKKSSSVMPRSRLCRDCREGVSRRRARVPCRR